MWKKRFSESNSHQAWNEYKKESNKLRKSIKKARRLFERKIVKSAGKNKQAFFKYVNSRLTVRPEITAMKGKNGHEWSKIF